jgi:hypothetical protein
MARSVERYATGRILGRNHCKVLASAIYLADIVDADVYALILDPLPKKGKAQVEISESEKHRAPNSEVEPVAPDAADQLLDQSKPLSPSTIESCDVLLKSKGWSSGAVAHIQDGKTVYVVTCNRGPEWILGKGETQLTAWKDAAKRA